MTILLTPSPASVGIAAFYKFVRPHVPGCHRPVLEHEIAEAASEFCRRSRVWRDEAQEISVQGPTETTTSGAVASGATSVPVASITGLAIDDTVLLTLTDGRIQRTTLSAAPSALTLTIAAPLIAGMDSGALVSRVADTYAMTFPANAVLAEVIDARFDGETIAAILPGEVEAIFPDYRTETDTPTRYLLEDDEQIQLISIPDAAGVLNLRLAFAPAYESASVPSWIFERYRNAIASGALARLMASPKKPYTDMKLAGYHQGVFDDAIADASVRADRGNTRASLRTTCYSGLPLDD